MFMHVRLISQTASIIVHHSSNHVSECYNAFSVDNHSPISYSYKTTIGVHEMHGRMHAN